MRSSPFIMALSLALVAVFVSCNQPISAPAAQQGFSISVTNDINARTIEPALTMVPATYTVTGIGPNSATFTVTTIGETVVRTSLGLGTWTIAVNAVNADGILIGTGTATAQVNDGVITTVSIPIGPISGTGTLSLGIEWPVAQVQVPSINASLTPALGSPQSLPFVLSGASASYSSLSIGSGYYTLGFSLLDNGIVVAGAMEIVRIVANQPTAYTFSFPAVNVTMGSLQMNSNVNLQNPLTVNIAGTSTPIIQSSALSLTASVPGYAGSVAYSWYINGASDGTGATYVFGANKAFGYYRVSVSAFSADATRAGSATTVIQVAVAGPAMVDLGTARDFAVLAGTGVSIGIGGGVTGNVGLNAPSAGLVGFGEAMDSSNAFSTSASIGGRLYAANYAGSTPAILTTAYADKTAASNDAAGRMTADGTDIGAGVLGDLHVFAPGLYKWNTALSITEDITLNGGPDDVWIFQMNGGLALSTNRTIHLTGGADPKNIFWYASGAAGLAANTAFEGILFSDSAITTGVGATVNGRLYAQTTITIGGTSTVTQPSP